jgi:hypothetical protein
VTSPAPPEQVTLARARLAEAEGLEPAEQVALYDDVHQLLQQALEELDAAAPAGGDPTPP